MGQSYNHQFSPRGAADGPVKTFEDDFAADITGWTGYDLSTCSHSLSQMDEDVKGTCNYNGSTEGVQPSEDDSWAVAEWASGNNNAGIALRTKTVDMTNTEYFYVARSSNANSSLFRVCDGDTNDANCETMGENPIRSYDHGVQEIGMRLLFAVAGTGDDTVLCYQFYPASDGTDYCVPANWGNFERCMNDDGTPENSKLDSFIDCGGDTLCDTWGSLGPDDWKDFPAAGQSNTRWYNGSTGRPTENFCGGDL